MYVLILSFYFIFVMKERSRNTPCSHRKEILNTGIKAYRP